MIHNKKNLISGLTGVKRLHDRIIEFKQINKQLQTYKWVKKDTISTPAFNRFKQYYIQLLNLITVQASEHLACASGTKDNWNQYLTDYLMKDKPETPKQLKKIQKNLNDQAKIIY